MTCQFCEKKGLPIMPLRYAVARADMPFAPKLQDSFAPHEAISLPGAEAHYTLRLLRAGYLYVFDEVRGEWTAYVVTHEGYLYEFDPDDSEPPAVQEKHFSCKTSGHGHIARCVTVKDAHHAGRIWLGFSDAPWSAATLAKHRYQAYREAHMGLFDMAAWRSGGSQAHVGVMQDAATQVTDFVASQRHLDQHENNFLQTYFPKVNELLDDISNATKEALSPWNYSPQPMVGKQDQAESLMTWLDNEDFPFAPVMTAIPDAPGIAMELNGLAIQLGIEWLDKPERQWPLKTIAAIESLKGAVKAGAVKNEIMLRKAGAWASMAGMASTPGAALMNQDYLNDLMENADNISLEDQIKLGQEKWQDDYAPFLKLGSGTPNKIDAFQQQFKEEFATYCKASIKPLDDAYLAWFASDQFSAHFSHNFDPASPANGLAYQALVHGCIQNACGRNGSVAYFTERLNADPTDPNNILLRSLIFNQDALAANWDQQAKGVSAKDAAAWFGVGSSLYNAIVKVMGEDLSESSFAGLSHMFYQLTTAIMQPLADFASKGGALALAALPQQRQLVLMQAMLKSVKGKNYRLLNLSGMQSRKQMANAMADFLAEVSGYGNANTWRRAAKVKLRELAADRNYRWGGLFVVDETTLRQVESMKKSSQRVASVRTATEVNQFSTLLESNARFIMSKEHVAGGIGVLITGITMGFSIKAYADAKNVDGYATTNLMAGGVGAVSAVGELSGSILEKTTAWGGTALARRVAFGGVEAMTRGALVSLGAKLVGGLAGAVTGVVQMFQGGSTWWDGDHAYAVGSVVLGLATVVISIFLLSASFLVLLVVAILLAIANFLVSLLKHDDIQQWLSDCYFGTHELGDAFKNYNEQHKAFMKLTEAS